MNKRILSLLLSLLLLFSCNHCIVLPSILHSCNVRDDCDYPDVEAAFCLSLRKFGSLMGPCRRQSVDFTRPAIGVLTEIVRLSEKRGDGEVCEGKRFSLFILCGHCALFGCLHTVRLTL